MSVTRALSAEQLEQFEKEGYLLVKGLFSAEEVEEIGNVFAQISQTVVTGHFEPQLDESIKDPLLRYPRVMHPHRFNDTAMKFMLHPPVMEVLSDLYGEPALAAQSMFYFKPPKSRGQALHQDNFYLKVEPGNCIAAWTAIDSADEENGGLLIVPKTGGHEISCPELADSQESFTTHYVKPPKEEKAIPAIMDKGDVLFFNGNLIHGSYRNKSDSRFRRAFICHYANESATHIGSHYRPLYKGDGTPVLLESNPDGGPCGYEFDSPYAH